VHTAIRNWWPFAEFVGKYSIRRACQCMPAFIALCLLLSNAQVQAQTQTQSTNQNQSVQVLHWWMSSSEHKAVALLSGRLAQDNISWTDAVIPSGSGIGAGIVLKSRMLAGNAPEFAQLNGVIISEWADLGLLLEIDAIAAEGKWEKNLFPSVWNLIRPRQHPVAIPLGIHRINTLFYNRKVFARFELNPPASWDEFEIVARKLQAAGIIPLAQSAEPWQVATLFETLVLAESDAVFYREAFVHKTAAAFTDARFARALTRLRWLKKWMPQPLHENTWTDMTRMMADGDAAMLVMGDWAKGELNAWGIVTDGGFSCVAVPRTAAYHLYDIDTLVMLAKDASFRSAQEKIAQIALAPAMQAEYNQIKGSISVLRNLEPPKNDRCAQSSWKVFSRGSAVQVPSLAHRMATDEISKDAIIAEVMRFFSDDKIAVTDTQRRLAAISRNLPK